MEQLRKWCDDFIKLSDLFVEGKYMDGEEQEPFEEIGQQRWVHEHYGEVYTYQTCMIFYFSFLIKKDMESLKQFARIAYCSILCALGEGAESSICDVVDSEGNVVDYENGSVAEIKVGNIDTYEIINRII